MRFINLLKAAVPLLYLFGLTQGLVHERLNEVPAEWTSIGRATPSTTVRLHIAVKQRNIDSLESLLLEHADPNSPTYGQHLTFEQVNELTRPHTKSINSVKAWLIENGIKPEQIKNSPNHDWLSIHTTVGTIEKMLSTEYNVYVHPSSKTSVTRTLEYSIPDELVNHIDFIGPSIRFPNIRTHKPSRHPVPVVEKVNQDSAPNACVFSVEPSCLKALYNIGSYTSKASNNSAAVTGFLEQYISLTDLQTFFKQYDTTSVGKTPKIVGPNVQTSPGVEASLDIQYLMAMGEGVPATFEYTAGRQPGNDQNEPFLDWLTALASNPNPPLVYSTSYGDNENTVQFDYATRVNAEFIKAGARGISLLYSSGDGGVGGGQPTSCTKFIPTFPAGSPYVTSVGSTQSSKPETAASFSSGGFSNYFSQPSYQTNAVNDYLTKYGKNLPSSSLYNATGRGFPDVSCQGVSFNVVVSGFSQPVSGTSASSPTFAGIVSLLNDVRLAAGKTSLGFLNPLFYSNIQAFNDVTTGSNPGCNTNGFPAAQAWDPVTGLGTPDFAKLSNVVLALP